MDFFFYVTSAHNGNYTLSTTRGFMSPFKKFMTKPKRKDEMESTVRNPTKQMNEITFICMQMNSCVVVITRYFGNTKIEVKTKLMKKTYSCIKVIY